MDVLKYVNIPYWRDGRSERGEFSKQEIDLAQAKTMQQCRGRSNFVNSGRGRPNPEIFLSDLRKLYYKVQRSLVFCINNFLVFRSPIFYHSVLIIT